MEKDRFYDDISILVIGYDGYKDVWDHFFALMNLPFFVIESSPSDEFTLEEQTKDLFGRFRN